MGSGTDEGGWGRLDPAANRLASEDLAATRSPDPSTAHGLASPHWITIGRFSRIGGALGQSSACANDWPPCKTAGAAQPNSGNPLTCWQKRTREVAGEKRSEPEYSPS